MESIETLTSSPILSNTNAPIEKPLSPTDSKIQCLVIFREVLAAVAVVTALTGFFLTVVVSPLWALTIIPIVALGILISQLSIEGPPLPPTSVVIPVRIGMKNKSANCWAIAAFTFLCKVPLYRKIIIEKKELFPCLYKNLLLLEKAQAPLDENIAQEIRVWLADETARFHEILHSPAQQTDPMILIEHFFQKAELHCEQQKRSYVPLSEFSDNYELRQNYDPLAYLDLSLDEGTAVQSLDALLENFFFTVADNDTVKKVNFTEPPKDLLIHLRRGYSDLKTFEFKINASVEGMAHLRLREDFCSSQPEFQPLNECKPSRKLSFATYRCDAFIQHTANTTFYGHHQVFFLENGKWYRQSDAFGERITQEEAEKEMKMSDIFHYQFITVPQAL